MFKYNFQFKCISDLRLRFCLHKSGKHNEIMAVDSAVILIKLFLKISVIAERKIISRNFITNLMH